MRTLKNIFSLILLLAAVVSCGGNRGGGEEVPDFNGPTKLTPRTVKVNRTSDGKWQLLVDGEPYYVNGGAIGTSSALEYSIDIKNCGGNTLRLYNARATTNGFDIKTMLDQAYKQGLMIHLGLGMRAAKAMDYSNAITVSEQKNLLLEYVKKYKDHPAILCWCVGNEVESGNLDNYDMWRAIGDMVKSVHELDDKHPVTYALAASSKPRTARLVEYAPDIDFLSINSYYNGVGKLPGNIKDNGVDLPYMVTEFGPRLYTNPEASRKLPWNDFYGEDTPAVVEETSSEKEAIYETIWVNDIKANEVNGCLGSFSFVWGYQTQGKVLNWYSLSTPDHYLYGGCDAMQKCWTGKWPAARAPRIASRKDMTMNGKYAEDAIKVPVGSSNTAKVVATNLSGAPLRYRWLIYKESDHKKDGTMPDGIEGLFTNATTAEVSFKAPSEPGPYRLYVFVLDDANKKAASACIPFYAE